METRIRRSPLGICVVIVMISCCISVVACDVPDDVVYTDLHKNVRIGDSVVLTCRFRGTPLAVYWKKGDDPKTAPNLVSWIPTDDVTGLCEGETPCRIMEMNEDRSLVIKEVSIAEQGQYICRVSSYKGILIHNFTNINVFSPPKKPYPFINECLRSPALKSNQTCIISTTKDPINISCTASGYFPDLDLFFLHGSQYITALHSEETTTKDGKKNKSITLQASSSPEPYMCVASDIPGVGGRSVASVLVTTASVDRSDSNLAVKIVVPLIFIILLVVVTFGTIFLWQTRQQEPVSYLELWKLVDEGDSSKVKDIVSKLVGNPKGKTAKEDLYRILCKWKEESSGNFKSLYRAIKELGFHDDLKRIKDFRECASVSVSDDDLAHICWHVHSCEDETVNPILRALYSTDRQGGRPIFSTSKGFENDLRMMKMWKSGSVPETVTYRSGSEETFIQVNHDEDDEMTPMDPILGRVHLKVKASPPNQTIRLCLALEEAGNAADKRRRPVYLQLAKTFFQIRDEYKSELTDGVSKEYALALTKRHCQNLGNTVGLPENIIDAANANDLGVIFRTDAMLRDWVLDQKCSFYEMRCRLQHTAERCNRNDIADVFIPNDQSNIMQLMGPDYRTNTDANNQCPRNTVSDGTCRNNEIFEEEFIELARRLVMADVHPFAEGLGISDQLLTSYKPNSETKQLDQGTIMILKAVKTKDRSEMFEVLKTAGYSEEADAIYSEPVSYMELWKLVDEGDLAKVKDIVSKLVGKPDGITSKENLYRMLCEWKEGSSGNIRSLYRAIQQLGLHDYLKRIKDFRACKSVSVSDDDLAHICWHVRSCEDETINPILRALYSSDMQGGRPIFSTSSTFKNELRMMKKWKSGSKPETVKFRSGSKEIVMQVRSTLSTPDRQDIPQSCTVDSPAGNDEDDEMTPKGPITGEVHLKVKASPPNQTIRLCLALEEAGKTADEHHRTVYFQLAKAFFQIRAEYKRELTDGVLKEFGLSLTKPHCQRLGNILGLPKDTIDATNEDDLGVIFQTDAMLRNWVKDQKCSYYEMRRRLRQTAERCNRNDIADVFIPKDQSNIMSPQGPDCLKRTDDNQCPRNSVSDDIEDVSRDEFDRIERYAGSQILLETPPLHTSLTRKVLDGLASGITYLVPSMKWKKRDTLRERLRKERHTYSYLLPVKRSDTIFDVEFIEMAFRLVMAEVHPFAEGLGISDQLLTSYKPSFAPKQLEQGTVMMLKEGIKEDRSEMFDVLKKAGYSEEAKAIYFGFEISLHDVLEVENQVNMVQLASKLSVPEDVQPDGPANETSRSERQHSVLFRWKDTVRSSTFNHRLYLSDTIFTMGDKELALNIISGVYRKRVINNSVSELLANTIKDEQLSTLCEVLDQEGSNCQDVIAAWATKRSKSNISGANEEKPRELSNKLLQNGFYHFAYEIMAGTSH